MISSSKVDCYYTAFKKIEKIHILLVHKYKTWCDQYFSGEYFTNLSRIFSNFVNYLQEQPVNFGYTKTNF